MSRKLSEDWTAVALAAILFLVSATGLVPIPKIATWSFFPALSQHLSVSLLVFFLILGSVGFASGGLRCYPAIFLAALSAVFASKQVMASTWGLESVIWALFVGLTLRRFTGIRLSGEIFIKTGLVLLGAEILLPTLLACGLAGLFEVTVGLAIVWYSCYWFARRLGLTQSFASILASATSICGVSAAIAAGGAVKGDPKEISHTISLVLLFAIPMLVLMPAAARFMGLPPSVAGAWIGGTIDTTPAVVAAGSLYGDAAMKVASVVKMSQNIMIAVAAFALSVWWTARVECKPEERPNAAEIWRRFPKFVLGFIMACIVATLLTSAGYSVTSIVNVTKEFRGYLFAMAFVGIGLNTDFRELARVGGGKPLIVFLAAMMIDLVVSLASAWIFFGP